MGGMGERQPVRITITLEGELDPTTVKAEAFSFALARSSDEADESRREMTERAASHLGGRLRASPQRLVMATDGRSLLEVCLPRVVARNRLGFSVMVDAPDLG